MASAPSNLLLTTSGDGMYVHHHTTTMAPVQVQRSTAAEVEWNSALLDCFEDVSTCCYGCWCCPCLTCTVSGRLQEHYCLPLCDALSCYLSPVCHVLPAALGLRIALRKRYKLKGSVLEDLAISCCCVCCSWCQMHRELKYQNRIQEVINIQNVVSVQPPPLMPQNPVTQTTFTAEDSAPLKY